MRTFLKSFFCESDGTSSMARLQSFIYGGFVLWWVTKMVYATHMYPDIATISGLSAFALGPYTVNKVSTMFAKNPNA